MQAANPQILGGHRSANCITFNPDHTGALSQRNQVAADATAKITDTHATSKALRTMSADALARRLFKRLAREVHFMRAAELCCCPRAQQCHLDRRPRQPGAIHFAQPLQIRQQILFLQTGSSSCLQRLLAARRKQFRKRLAIHGALRLQRLRQLQKLVPLFLKEMQRRLSQFQMVRNLAIRLLRKPRTVVFCFSHQA